MKILKGPVVKMGAFGEINSHYCRAPEGNLIAISSYFRRSIEGARSTRRFTDIANTNATS